MKAKIIFDSIEEAYQYGVSTGKSLGILLGVLTSSLVVLAISLTYCILF